MRNVTLKHPIRHMFVAFAGFVLATALIESAGLKTWADRLEPGLLRTIAVPATAAMDAVVRPLGIAGLRDRALDQTARLGWSDDDARLARLSRPAAPSRTVTPPAAHAPETQTAAVASPAVQPASLAPIAAPALPLVASIPRSTALAPLPPVQPGRPRVVALAGDSMMAVGLSATLMRQAVGDKNLRIVKAFRSGTGLARPDFFNWMDEYPAMVGAYKPDVVIVSIGANDGQGFVVDGKVQAFGTDDWRATYRSRVAGYLSMIESCGARVVWVGLPPMRSVALNEKIAVINRIAYTVVSQDPRATWWNSAPYVADESGRFREFLALANGKNIHVRSDDGIHYSDEGASLMVSVLMKWLDPPVESAGNEAVPARPAAWPGRSARAAGTAILAVNP